MRVFLALLLVLLSAASYFVLAIQFGIRQNLPALHILLGLAACAFLFREAIRAEQTSKKILRAAALVFGLAIVSGFTWYTLAYSAYDRSGPADAQGEIVSELAALQLERHDGQLSPLLSDGTTAKATLLVLYRGHW